MSHNATNPSRVALLSLHSSPDAPLGRSDAGGMNLYVRELAGELASLGIAVDMFTRRTQRDQPEIRDVQSGIRLIHIDAGPAAHVPKRLLPLYIPTLTQGLVQFAEDHQLNYDVLNCHYWLSGLVGLRCRDRLQAPVVSMFHTLSRVKESYLEDGEEHDSALRFDGERRVLSGSDAIIGATSLELEQFERYYGVTPDHFEVVAPGVDTQLFHRMPRAECRRRLGVNSDQMILFIGRLDPMKQVDVLLRAVAQLPLPQRAGLRLVLVGGRDSSDMVAARGYMEMAEQLGISALIDMRSNVPQHDLPLYYSAADVTAVPSAYESFGMVAIESLACETPVVGFDVGGLSTTIAHGCTGFLAEPGNVTDFSRQLSCALDAPSLNAMGRRGRLSVQGYDWGTIGRRTAEIFAAVSDTFECRSERLAGVG